MVPEADFTSYYGRPILKSPAWEQPHVQSYLFLGGLAGASALIGAMGELTARPALARTGRLGAAGAATGGTVFLILDLGRPMRFLNMLRVLKPTSPLSVGSWILAPFASLAAASAASEVTGIAPGLGRLASYGSAALAAPLSTYTAALLADTAVPAWHEAHRSLPFVFAGSAMTAGAGLALLAAPPAQAGPVRRMAVAGAAVELAATHRIEHGLGLVGEPWRSGRPKRLLDASKGLTAAGVAGALLGGRSRLAARLGGASLLAASLLTRFGVYDTGMVSAADPKYVVVPQRERLEARRQAAELAAGERAGV